MVLVSVIIPTKNCENRDLALCFNSIKNQTHPDIEIIVADDHSVDKTKEICEKYAKVFTTKGPTGSQRNFGAKVATGEFIFFVDSDMELPKTMIEECVKLSKDYDAVLMEDEGVAKGFWGKCHSFEKSLHLGDTKVTSPRFINKKKYWEIKGLDESMCFNEDLDLHERMKKNNFKIGHIDLLIKHYEEESLKKIITKYFKTYGSTAGNYLSKNKSNSLKIYLFYHPYLYIKNWRKILKDPIHGFGSIARKIIEYASTGSGLIYYHFKKR